VTVPSAGEPLPSNARPARALRARTDGYAMVALLVAMSVMAIMMTVAMPVWRQTNQREKEDELVFRGLQYTRAIGLYEKKYANTPPPSIDVLVQQHYLRKKYKDPITNDEFLPVVAGQPTPAATTGQPGAAQPAPTAAQTLTNRGGGVTGVMSKSKATSIRIYNGRTHYNEWQFVYAPAAAAPGAGGAPGGQRGGAPNPGGRGNPGGGGPANGGPRGGGPPQGQPGGTGRGGPAVPNPFQLPVDIPPGRGR
jgi:type II secretory pathway pseudopilin PulG